MKTSCNRTMTRSLLSAAVMLLAAAVLAVSAVSCEEEGAAEGGAGGPQNILARVITFNANGGGIAPDSVTWRGGAGLTLPSRGSMEKGGSLFDGWAEGSPTGSRVSDPYIPSADTTLYARWIDLDALLAEAKAGQQNMKEVLGNPEENNTSGAASIGAAISALETALRGAERAAIEMAGEELTRLMEHFTGEIIVQTMLFEYIEPAVSNRFDPAQRAALRSAGVYEIELLGAAGGHTVTRNDKTGNGGKGGYVKAEYLFSGDTDVAVRVGGMGQGTVYYDGNSYTAVYPDWETPVNGRTRRDVQPGGYNGGGSGGGTAGTDNSAGSGGGGATDVRLWIKKDTALTGVKGDPRIVVAAGGGGAAQGSIDSSGSITNPALPGGNGGGTAGEKGSGDIPANAAAGGTPNSGGTATAYCTPGKPGFGSNGIGGMDPPNGEGRGGGGGGWWGGAAGTENTTANNILSGAGGSSYTGGSSGITPVGNAVNETYRQDFWGNGWARITWKRGE